MINDENSTVVLAAMDKLKQGRFTEDVYRTITRHPTYFLKFGVSATLSKSLMDLKRKIAFCPDPLSYSIQNPDRVDYIHRHVDDPNAMLTSANEKRFEEALSKYYYMTDLYRLEERSFFEKFNHNEEEAVLTKTPTNLMPSLLPDWNKQLRSMEQKVFFDQQQIASEALANYAGKLRPGMLTDKEIIDLIKLSKGPLPGREGEAILMSLPEVFFPLVEESEEFDKGMIDYVKVHRSMERVTPSVAYNSMSYYISNRLILDPNNSSFRHFPNADMVNPSEKFSPNLLSEQQWEMFMQKYTGEAYLLMPFGAFRKDRITDVEVYPTSHEGRAIRCKVDGQQQNSVILSEEDARNYCPQTDRAELAVGYFTNAFAKEDVRDLSLTRRI